jgi:hypothetical protein
MDSFHSQGRRTMFHLPVRTWICNAAAVFSGQHGSVTEQAQKSGCSRETVYEHARKVEERVVVAAGAEAEISRLHAENQELQGLIADLKRDAQGQSPCDADKLRELATTALAMGLSFRQIEELLGVLLPPGKAPDHSTIARWVGVEAVRASEVLKIIDQHCSTEVKTLAIDEIFFGGDRPWLASSHQAWRPSSARRRATARPRPGRSN